MTKMGGAFLERAASVLVAPILPIVSDLLIQTLPTSRSVSGHVSPNVSDGRIERTARQAHRQFDTEDLQQPSNFVFKIDAFTLHDLADGKQCSDVMTFDAFHMHPTVPPRPEDLRNATGVVLVRLVAHGR